MRSMPSPAKTTAMSGSPPRRRFRVAGAFAVVRGQRVFATVPGLGKAIAHCPACILLRPLVTTGEVKDGRAQGIVSARRHHPILLPR